MLPTKELALHKEGLLHFLILLIDSFLILRSQDQGIRAIYNIL